jgi:hypothetical protein
MAEVLVCWWPKLSEAIQSINGAAMIANCLFNLEARFYKKVLQRCRLEDHFQTQQKPRFIPRESSLQAGVVVCAGQLVADAFTREEAIVKHN